MYQGLVMYDNLQLFILDEFQIDMVVGHGPLNGSASDPVMNMQISLDSGNTWGSMIQCDVPRTGYYAGRVRWLRGGSARNMVVRLIFTEDMQFQSGEARMRTRTAENP